jgi:hypothetical protein
VLALSSIKKRISLLNVVSVMDKCIQHLFVVREWGRDLGFNLEIEKCLREFHGHENVDVIVIPNNANIFEFFANLMSSKVPKRIYLDSRIFIVDAYMPSLTKHLVEVSAVRSLFKSSNVIPVCMLTDALSAPGFLLVGELLVHGIGVLLPLGADAEIKGLSPKFRTQPIFNPISVETGEFFEKSKIKKSRDLFLGGAMYEPRKTFIERVVNELRGTGIELNVVPKKSDSYIDYLNELSRFKLVLNTNFAAPSEEMHMVGRNIETLHVGSLLLTQNTILLEELFTEGEHYINIESPSDAAEKIKYFLKNRDEAHAIASAGQEKALHYAREQYFLGMVNRKIDELNLDNYQ